MSRYTLETERIGSNGSAQIRVSVIDATGGTKSDAVDVTRASVREAAAHFAKLMPPAAVVDVERELKQALDGHTPPELLVRAARELCQQFSEMKPEIVEGLLREGESANVIAVSKRGKTFLALYLGLSIAAGRCIFGSHAVRRGPVLYIDAELHPNTLAKRITIVAEAMGLTADEYADTFHVVSLRGNLCDIYGLWTLFQRFKPGDYAAVFLDALYRLIPAGVDENSNSDMTPLYNTIDRYAEELGAAFFIIHHSSKGVQGHKGKTDVGAGAGAISRAADSHIILREHEEEDMVVMEAACRSFPPLKALCLRWDYPLWRAAPDLDPTQLRQEGRRRKQEPADPAEPRIDWTTAKFVESFVTDKPQDKDVITARAFASKLSGRAAERWLKLAEADGLVHRWAYPGKGNPFKLATIPQPITETT